jgi:Protein of unknown function (DUF2459)
MKRSALCSMGLLLLLAGCTAMPVRRAAQGVSRPVPPVTVYVARRGWHIDIGFRVSDLEPPLAAVAQDFPDARYLFFGFGDRRYLVSRNKNFPSMLAALWPGAGMVLATSLLVTPEEAFGASYVMHLRVSPARAQDAQDFVWNALVKTDAAVRYYAKGPYAGSLYYSAIPTYSAVHTCNTWVAEALQAAAVPIRSVAVVFAAQLWSQLQSIDATRQTLADGPASLQAIPHE